MGIVLFIIGVLLMAIAIGASIALHEVGHLVPAKLFNVRVPQYMVGFGKTVLSWRRGETEYGIKAIPLGGYISMIGMYPPGSKKAGSGVTGPFQQLMDDARAADLERLQDGDEDRQFYKLPIWKRMIIMLGGPSVNLLIGIVCTAILITGFGTAQATTTVSSVSQCVKSVSSTSIDNASSQSCSEQDAKAPASAAGIQPGDTIVKFANTDISSWEQLTSLIQVNADKEVPVTVERDGKDIDLTITPIKTVRPVYDETTGQPLKNSDGSYQTTEVGFIGVGPTSALVPGSVSEVPGAVASSLTTIYSSVWKLPAKVYGVAKTLVTNGERAADSPVSVVGVGRVAGEVAATDQIDLKAKVASLVSLVGSMNLFLFAFNLIPLLPLDGGHVFGALWEGIRRTTAKLFGRKDPGPFDPVKLLPLTFVVAGAFMLMSVILITADIFKPISIF